MHSTFLDGIVKSNLFGYFRFLVKTWQQVDSTKLTPTVAYLKTAASNGVADSWENSVEGIVKGFEIVAMR